MRLLKSLMERKTITIFFILAFTVGILIFSIGNSAIVSQKNLAKELNKENNKVVTFQNYQDVTVKEIIEILSQEKVNVLLVTVDNNNSVGIETTLLLEDNELNKDIKDGRKLTNNDLIGNKEIGLYSSRIDGEIEISSFDKSKKVKLERIGSYYDMERRVIIPNQVFIDLYGDNDVNISGVQIILRGDPENIKNVINKLELQLKGKNIQDGILVRNIDSSQKHVQGESLYNAAILIFIVTIINSISISSLWVKNRKKEIVLRKVFGAKNIDIVKIFFGELILISVLSFLLALLIQYILTILTGGYIGNIDLRLNIEVCIKSFVIAVITALSVSLPSLKYISKVQPAEMLKEE